MAGTPPNDPQNPWGNVPPSGYFQQGPVGPQGPAGAPGPNPYGPRVDLEAIGTAWRMITADLGTWVIAALIILAISYAINMVFQMAFTILFAVGNPFSQILTQSRVNPSAMPDLSILAGFYAVIFFVSLLTQGVVMTLNVGLMEMAIRRIEGRPISIGDLFIGFNNFGSILVVSLVTQLLAGIAFFFCIFPMFLVLGLFSFAPLLIVRGRARGFQALTMSYEILKPHMWMMALLVFCGQLLSGLGACLCLVGVLFTYGIFPISIGVIYSNFFPPTYGPRPQEGPSNYYRP